MKHIVFQELIKVSILIDYIKGNHQNFNINKKTEEMLQQFKYER
jgi:hypothetical protein